MKQIVIVADLQVPYEDPRYVKAVANYISAVRPDEVGQIGDLIDLPGPSRWSKGAAAEYAGDLKQHIDATRKILDAIKFDWVKTGNHDERLETYIQRYAPAMASWDVFSMEAMFETQARGIRLEREPFDVAPGWMAAHGHEGPLKAAAGHTAYHLGKEIFDCSVVCGHTHRAGILSKTVGLGKRQRVITGLEVGHGMAVQYATYIKHKRPNWQQAFGVLWVDGKRVTPQLVSVDGGKFILDGKAYAS